MDDRPSWATTQPTTPLTYVPPPATQRHVPGALLLLLGALIGIYIGIIFMSTINPSKPASEYRTPPSCIRALDLAAEGFDQIGTGLKMAGDSDLEDTSGMEAATTWLLAYKDEMGTVADNC